MSRKSTPPSPQQKTGTPRGELAYTQDLMDRVDALFLTLASAPSESRCDHVLAQVTHLKNQMITPNQVVLHPNVEYLDLADNTLRRKTRHTNKRR